MLVEVPIKIRPNTENPMYKAAMRDALVIIDNEIEDAAAEQRKSENMYNTGKLYGFKRIRGLLAATIEEGTE